MPIATLQIMKRITTAVCVPIPAYAYICLNNLAIACEVLARRIVHLSPSDRINSIMSTRYRHRQLDGDTSEMASALEMAIDSHWRVQSTLINACELFLLFCLQHDFLVFK